MSAKQHKLPKNWPSNLQFISSLDISKDLSKYLEIASGICRFSPKDIAAMERISISKFYGFSSSKQLSVSPTALNSVKIESLADKPSHPASPYFGLFATKNLSPGQLIIPYYGKVTTSENASETSDYCLRLNCLAVDADSSGNEGRYVNDYRGILDKPNAEFKEFINTDYNRVEMGIFVISSKLHGGIKKKQEICVSYGKGFWSARK
ncbi:hypothetical protein AYI69_g2105 [Smittium culicis]|uniref:SET domain-containing protein n=1 Tax=Smittium culicis TaxID=133412 RepID=A0A1R1YNC7_9FUNG|nr:hypothetical protein AYI69_g2105 [Smittium culicis]